MKANNLTISVENHGCDKDCPYCISKITGNVNSNRGRVLKNLSKVKTLTSAAQVSSVLITSKGETLLNYDDTLMFIDHFERYPLELQTNGVWLSKNTDKISELANAGLNIVSISVDSKAEISSMRHMLRIIKAHNMLVRICFNFTDYVKEQCFAEFMSYYFYGGDIDQVLIRNVGYPRHNKIKTDRYIDWINEHNAQEKYNDFYQQVVNDYTSPLIRTLAHGAKIFDVNGIAVCFSDYCIQEAHNEEDIRSLIFLEDGHLYTSWSSMASKLF
jgi:uncharacterized Fe-S cluster-containing radical SAM superfamily protein